MRTLRHPKLNPFERCSIGVEIGSAVIIARPLTYARLKLIL